MQEPGPLSLQLPEHHRGWGACTGQSADSGGPFSLWASSWAPLRCCPFGPARPPRQFLRCRISSRRSACLRSPVPAAPCSATQKQERPPQSSAQPCRRASGFLLSVSSDGGHHGCRLSARRFPAPLGVLCVSTRLTSSPPRSVQSRDQPRAFSPNNPLHGSTVDSESPSDCRERVRRERPARLPQGAEGLPGPASRLAPAHGPGLQPSDPSLRTFLPHLPVAFPAR